MSRMVMKVYSAEFRADAVALYLSDPKNTYEGVAKDLGVSRETLRNWVRTEPRTGQASASRQASQPAQVSSDHVLEEENKQLRARIRELETEREILRRAAKYFAGETNW
jgi:transposase